MKYNNDTSHQIMKVALRLFSEKGYYPTTTKQIAHEADVNELTIFRHFGSKANLFQVTTEHYVIDAQVDHILDEVEQLDFEKSISLIATRICDLYEQNRKLYKVQMKLSDDEQDFVKLKLSRKMIGVLEPYFEGLKMAEVVKGDPHIMAVTLITSLLGAFTVDILGGGTAMIPAWQEIAAHHVKQFVALYQN
ncbi:MAG: TetR/AcrR family transcriptional regulator [Turicibacter sp.]|nr:TetR/AcrR family transcriptional regulator [Turicibacter sp.]